MDYHHGENDSSGQRFDDPEQNQAAELGDGEQVNLPQRDVSQIDKIWLVLRGHTDEFQAVKELKDEGERHRGGEEVREENESVRAELSDRWKCYY